MINSYASKKIKEIFEAGQKLYADLEDLYLYTNKIEQKAIFNLTNIFKQAIEKEQKIENEVQINYVEVL